jgi:hypothetical protein
LITSSHKLRKQTFFNNFQTMTSHFMGFILPRGTKCAAPRAEVERARCPCATCHRTNASGKKPWICWTAAWRITNIETLENHYKRAVAAGHLHQCPRDKRFYSMTPVQANGRTYQAWEYYAVPSKDHGLTATNCPCGAHRSTQIRYASAPSLVTVYRPVLPAAYATVLPMTTAVLHWGP